VKQSRLDQAADLLRTLNQIDTTPFEHLLAAARLFSENGHPAEAQEFLKMRLQAAPWDDEARLESAKVEAALNQKNPARDDFQKIVASSNATYDLRTAAAREQGKNGLAATGSTASLEIDLLSNRIPLTAANADAPFFFAARIFAAEQNSDPNVRVQLLLGAVAERPEDHDVRRKLFENAYAARQFRLALAVDRNFNPDDPQLAGELAEAHQQVGEFDAAVRLFKTASSLEKDNARRQVMEERAKQAQAAYDRFLENQRRRPVMRADLDQPNPVRRRLP
jgi:hypothetical protein